MKKSELQQKLVSFTYESSELKKIEEDMKEGWSIVSLVRNSAYYVGIMEINTPNYGDCVYIPPRKKIKIFSQS